MPSKIRIFFKSIGRKWFILLILLILIIAYAGWVIAENLTPAIVVTIIAIVLLIFSYITRFYKSKKLKRFMKKYYKIEDKTIAKKLGRSLRSVQDKMFELSQKQTKREKWQFWRKEKNWLILFLNRSYIFYHKNTIEKFKEFHHKGLGDKKILENLKEFNIETRAEVKAIEDALIKYERLSEREISVKEREERERFQNL